MDFKNLEMVTCPRCHKPFPKIRYDMGYKCCVNCSTEQPKACISEEVGVGEDAYTACSIVSQEEARAYERNRQLMRGNRAARIEIEEPDLNMSSFEEEEEVSASLQLSEHDAQLQEVLEADGFKETELIDESEESEDAEFSLGVTREARDAEVDDDPDA